MSIVSLDIILDIVKAVVGDTIAERLKPRTSVEKAKTRAFALYETLKLLETHSDLLVRQYRAYIRAFKSKASIQIIRVKQEEINDTLDCLLKIKNDLYSRIEKVNPQLELFSPKLFSETKFIMARPW